MQKYYKIFNIILVALAMVMFFTIGFHVGKKYDIALDENDDYITITYSANEQKIRRLMNLIDNYYIDSLNTDALIDKTINFVTENLDPHSSYIPKSMSPFKEQEFEGYYEGLGINYLKINDSLIITHSNPYSPNRDLFKLSDRILAVNKIKIDSSNIDSAFIYIRGKAGTPVSLTLLRNGQKINIEAKRTRIQRPSVSQYYMISDNLGYIKLNKFIETSAKEMNQAILNLQKQGMTSLVLDLRNNPGGLLDIAQEIADEFLKKDQLIVYTKDKEGKKELKYATEKGLFENKPLYILLNEGSASASEIIAGAIQDQDAGTIIGRRSYGKGLVQKEISLGDGSKIRLTTAKYYTPTGRSIQKPYTVNDKNYNNDLRNRITSGELYSLDSIKKIDSLKFKTPKGKIVYGGGGIIPDNFIPLDTIGIDRWFYDHGYNYNIEKPIFEFVDKNHTTLQKISKIDFIKFYNVNELADELTKQVKIWNPKNKEKELRNFNVFVKATMAKFLYGEDAYNQVWNSIDPMIIEAKELDKARK